MQSPLALLIILALLVHANDGIDVSLERSNENVRVDRTLYKFIPLTKISPKYRTRVRKVYDGNTIIWEDPKAYALDAWVYSMGEEALLDILTVTEGHEGGNKHFVKIIVEETLREPINIPSRPTALADLDAFSVESMVFERDGMVPRMVTIGGNDHTIGDSILTIRDDDDDTDTTDEFDTTDEDEPPFLAEELKALRMANAPPGMTGEPSGGMGDHRDHSEESDEEEEEFVDALEYIPAQTKGDLEAKDDEASWKKLRVPSSKYDQSSPSKHADYAQTSSTPIEASPLPPIPPSTPSIPPSSTSTGAFSTLTHSFRERRIKRATWKPVTRLEFEQLLKSFQEQLFMPRERPLFKSEFVRPEAPPKYLAVDIMRTFYSKDKHVLRENIESFGEAMRSGYVPFFCTAETYAFSFRLMGSEFVYKTDYVGFPGVYNNGAVVYDEHGRTIRKRTFPKEFMRDFFTNFSQHCTANRCRFHTTDGSFTISEYDESYTINFQGVRHRNVPLEELLDLPYIGMTLKYKDVKIKGYTNGIDYYGRSVGDGLYLISQVGVNKATGIAALMAHYNVPANACAFVGDGMNDVEAMEQSDLSFAVGNAREEVKRHAKWILDRTCDEAAVSELIYALYGTGELTDVHIARGKGRSPEGDSMETSSRE